MKTAEKSEFPWIPLSMECESLCGLRDPFPLSGQHKGKILKDKFNSGKLQGVVEWQPFHRGDKLRPSKALSQELMAVALHIL